VFRPGILVLALLAAAVAAAIILGDLAFRIVVYIISLARAGSMIIAVLRTLDRLLVQFGKSLRSSVAWCHV
jgi:hypothetical protein